MQSRSGLYSQRCVGAWGDGKGLGPKIWGCCLPWCWPWSWVQAWAPLTQGLAEGPHREWWRSYVFSLQMSLSASGPLDWGASPLQLTPQPGLLRKMLRLWGQNAATNPRGVRAQGCEVSCLRSGVQGP